VAPPIPSRSFGLTPYGNIDGGAFCNQLTATGQVSAPGAHIRGQLDLRGATLTRPDGTALNLVRARVDLLIFDYALAVPGDAVPATS